MKFGQRLAALILVMPGALYAGDFSNPTPYGSSGSSSSGVSSFSMVSVATAESLRIANINAGPAQNTTNVYNELTSVTVGSVTIGDGNTGDITIDQTSNADGFCINSSNNILNRPTAPTDQTCDGVPN